MNRNFIVLLCSLPLFGAGAPTGDTPSDRLKSGVGQFNAAYSAWDRKGFEAAARTFQEACAAFPESYDAHYWLGAARMHLLLHRLGDKDNPPEREEAGRLMREAVAPLERAVALDPGDSEAHALLSTLLGMQIAHNPPAALWLGRKTLDYRRCALRNDPRNPRAHYLLGTSYFHAPALLGGREKGLEHFLEAERLFEAESRLDRDPLRPAWGRDSCLSFIGRIYSAMDDPEKAEKYFREALALNPQEKMARKGLESLGCNADED
jgi:tetratricopeptide (TPR) repeat protein